MKSKRYFVWQISIHALREEDDQRFMLISPFWYLFLSTPSARRATRPTSWKASMVSISIHALREEGDPTF